MNRFEQRVVVSASKERVFEAITNGVPDWWTHMFDGVSDEKNGRFTVRFGEHIFKTMQVEKLIPQDLVVWFVEQSRIGIPTLVNQEEWTGTWIVWQLENREGKTIINLTHEGLTPAIECYDICVDGWQQFLQSLKQFVETGIGMPFGLPQAESAQSEK